MRPTRSLTQPNDSSHTSKKHSNSSGSGDATDASPNTSGASTTQPRTSPSAPTSERNESFHNVKDVASQIFCKPLRTIVSQNRRRYQTDGFDLDLTYITDRIIAMGYPADTSEALYRNSMNDTQNFLERHHPGHYKVFNLRGQYVYDPSKFHHRVVSFEMTDHHPPRLELMAPFCREVHQYLSEDPRNVVAVHCKAGKGRTGVMICAYLVYINFYPSPRQNMDYYSIVRTKNNKGVTIPSQRRYVYYFSHLRNHSLNYMPLRVELVGIYLENIPLAYAKKISTKTGFELRVANGDVDVFLGDAMWLTSDAWNEEEESWSPNIVSHGEGQHDPMNPTRGNDIISRRAWGWTVPKNKRVFLEGDVRVDLYAKHKIFMLDRDRQKMGHVWFNTMFVCPGFCRSIYHHGDEAHPYPDGATTIAEKKNRPHRPKAGSASLPNSPPGTPKLRCVGGSVSSRGATRTPSFDARKSAGRLPRFQLNSVVRRLADAASRNSEPHIDRNAEERTTSRKMDKKAMKEKEKERPSNAWDEDNTLMLPPGLDKHCSDESLRLIYEDRDPPRMAIEQMLKDAHVNNLIEDSYNHRRLSVPQEGQPVKLAPEGRPNASGPFSVRRKAEEHVQVFSVLEVDRACKSKIIDEGFKMYVVTKCLSPDNVNDQKLAESFVRVTHQKQCEKEKKKEEKARFASFLQLLQLTSRQRKLQGVGSGASLGDQEPDISNSGDPRRSDPLMSKFFHRQREDSLSKYPGFAYRCPLLVAEEPPAKKASPVDEDFPPRGAHPTSSFTSGEWEANSPSEFRAEELSELDMEVRSYHPDGGDYNSNSSRSSSSSDGCNALALSEESTSFLHR